MRKRELKADLKALLAEFVKLKEAADFTLRKYAERLGEQEREIASLVRADRSLNTVLSNVQQNLADLKLKREPQVVLDQLGQIQRLNGQMQELETKLKVYRDYYDVQMGQFEQRISVIEQTSLPKKNPAKPKPPLKPKKKPRK